ncbi:tRNA threonylcarbamoyladenosine dehydratase [Orrella daihaiensis]|uniref:tRNA threonylcarbamoyladenosine dehydratase n=1 Tax=Orrella daihaiensis TaxID=2782176 RepID=A0ABY4ASX2_9BURK|nr:tRNA threonylcarbamoyladenosine dehydratase [Orrella daihaiensis]UOD51139.1 tRNA threonylcarbamoyladenosine dehydratase [Orrella daihaiensis]
MTSFVDKATDLVGPADLERRFGSVDRAYGHVVTDTLRDCHVTVVGLGGVGSWAAEALARSGVGQLTLIDLDHVAQSNINRQVHALDTTLGQAKVLAMSERIGLINPACAVSAVEEFVETDNADALLPPTSDVVLDCTDQLSAKVAMVLLARQRQQALIVCGAAGGKTDALTLRYGDLRDSTHDALLARLRSTLRKRHGFSGAQAKRVIRMGVNVLWFEQPAHRPVSLPASAGISMPLACAGYGSLVTVTAAMGLAAAGKALDFLTQKKAS